MSQAPEPRKTLDPDQVAFWLARHPDFFIGRELNPRIGSLDIKEFCEGYQISFPLFAEGSVRGPHKQEVFRPLWLFLSSMELVSLRVDSGHNCLSNE